MPERSVITNTSPLLYLHQIGQLEILHKLYDTILVPPAVVDELNNGQKVGCDVPDVSTIPWITIRPVASPLLIPVVTDLGNGEAETIALGLEMENSLLILDDQLARRIAAIHGLLHTGTLGVLVKAKTRGYIPSVRDVITMLQTKGMWMRENVVTEALRLADELPR